jgi:hypothetical protein
MTFPVESRRRLGKPLISLMKPGYVEEKRYKTSFKRWWWLSVFVVIKRMMMKNRSDDDITRFTLHPPGVCVCVPYGVALVNTSNTVFFSLSLKASSSCAVYFT